MPGNQFLELLDFFGVAATNGRSRLEKPIFEKALEICFLRRNARSEKDETSHGCDRLIRLSAGLHCLIHDRITQAERFREIPWPAGIAAVRPAAFLRDAWTLCRITDRRFCCPQLSRC